MCRFWIAATALTIETTTRSVAEITDEELMAIIAEGVDTANGAAPTEH
jgi:hypothetical protein